MDDALSDHDGSDFASQDIHTDSKGDLDFYTDPEGDLGFYTVDELHNALCNDETTSVWLPVLPVKNIESSSSSTVSNKSAVVECPDESPTEAAETLITAAEVNDETTSVWLPVLPVKNIESSYSTVSDEPTGVECPDESPTEAAETPITAADQVFVSKEALFEGVILDVETTDDITTQPEDVGIKVIQYKEIEG